MSEMTPHTTGPCEQLLDYVYGELDEAGTRAFEEHLAGCARCQAEAKSFGRVRAASKKLMPTVEPSPTLGGALHAQLMHAAAQRQPRRGVLLAFPRKIVEHPAWAAAAMFAIVGSAVALNWSRGKMAMPVASDEAKPAEAPAPPAMTAAPAAEPQLDEKYKEAGGKSGVFGAVGKGGGDTDDTTKLVLDAPPAGRMTVQRQAAHHAAATGSTALAKPAAEKLESAKVAPPKKMKTIATKRDGVVDATLADGEVAQAIGGAAGSDARGGGVVVEGAPKSSVPREQSAPRAEESAPAQKQAGYARSSAGKSSPTPPPQTWANDRPSAPPQAAVANSAPAPVLEPSTAREPSYRGKAQSSVQGPTQQERYTDALRKRAVDLALSNRCDEAIKAYQELERRTSFISPQERVHYVHCLTTLGRQEQAQQALDELKNDKRVTNAELQQVENELAAKRRVTVEKKAKKSPAAPADRRAADLQEQRAQPAPPPAAAAPARSDDKKSQKAY